MEKRWFVYILLCGDGTLYTGMTDDIIKRIATHRSGNGAKYTRGRGPLRVCYLEELPSKSAALQREIAIKRMKRTEKMDLCETYKGSVPDDL